MKKKITVRGYRRIEPVEEVMRITAARECARSGDESGANGFGNIGDYDYYGIENTIKDEGNIKRIRRITSDAF